jgi:hypothetical protein
LVGEEEEDCGEAEIEEDSRPGGEAVEGTWGFHFILESGPME